MRLSAIHNETNTLIQISDIANTSEIDENIIYITGQTYPKEMTVVPLTISYDGIILFKAYKIELDLSLYHSIELTY